MQPLVRLEKITKVYQLGDQTFTALKNISLELAQGDMTAIVGVSGSGKSTLMNIIGLLDRFTEGHYFLANQNVSQLSESELATLRNKKIGFVFQSFFLLTRASALQNVMLPLFYRGIPHFEAKEKAQHFLEKMGVAHLAHHKPNQLSGGQQQRIAIARALVNDPEIILADEPTGSLDSKTSNEVMQLFTNLNQQEGRSIVIITHDREVSKRCSRIITIKDGHIE